MTYIHSVAESCTILPLLLLLSSIVHNRNWFRMAALFLIMLCAIFLSVSWCLSYGRSDASTIRFTNIIAKYSKHFLSDTSSFLYFKRLKIFFKRISEWILRKQCGIRLNEFPQNQFVAVGIACDRVAKYCE